MQKRYLNIKKNGQAILENVRVADTFLSRLSGLMFRKDLKGDGGLYLTPCNQIHTFLMKFEIDAIFVSRQHEVLHIESNIKPCRVSRHVKGAAAVIETAPGFAGCAGIVVGDELDFIEKRKDYGRSTQADNGKR